MEDPAFDGVLAITTPYASTEPSANASALIEAAAAEAIFVRDGIALEGTHTNLFAVFRGVVRTPPLTNYILPGVTRAVVLDLCGEAGFEVVEELGDLAALLAVCRLYVGGDTGPMHTASLVGTPVVQLLGPTDQYNLLMSGSENQQSRS